MAFKVLFFVLFVISSATAQTYRACVLSSTPTSQCQSLSIDDSRAVCVRVESRVDCALKLSRGEADIGYFSEEETMLLAQQLPNINVVASVRDPTKMDPYAFESVAVVPANHTGGLEGLRNGAYCHPGLDERDLRWSPRVLKTLEELAARTDRCPDADTAGKTAEELEVDTVSRFFSQACRPGTWSANTSVDADLKSRYPSLCALCGTNSGCSGYTIDMGVTIAGVRNDNRHIQALECLRTNANRTAVAYVAWQHTKEFFTLRNPTEANSFAVLCTNGTLIRLTADVLNANTSPCAFIRQPWGAIVTSNAAATELLANLQTWWPNGNNPGGNTWQSILFSAVISTVSSARVVFEAAPVSMANYTSTARDISPIDSSASCLRASRWCTISAQEQTKCAWVRASAYSLGIQPRLECQQRASVLECLKEIRDDRADFISAPSNYGYLARKHYKLSPVKLVQNMPDSTSRIAAFVKETAVVSSNITRFENLRDKKACFPEYGGLAYVSFVRAGQERGVLSDSECDYARVVGEFFSGACAPGALDAEHALGTSDFDSTALCSVCKPTVTTIGNFSELICSWDYTNRYFGNNGSLACLADPDADVAFLNVQGMAANLQTLNLQANQFRALCRNNTVAVNTGVAIDDGCLLAHVVDAEIVTRRGDPQYNSLNALFDNLDYYFGYNAGTGNQLINLEIISPFDGISDLLFKDSTIGFTEPTSHSTHQPARNYIELFKHLDACTSTAAPPAMSQATRTVYALLAIIVMSFMTQFVIY